jgi:hypothetical protein
MAGGKGGLKEGGGCKKKMKKKIQPERNSALGNVKLKASAHQSVI